MLNINSLEQSIKNSLEGAFKDALMSTFDAVKNGDEVSPSDLAGKFSKSAGKYAHDIASAIDEYIRSAQITINTGTSLVGLGLASPSGPVTGSLTLAAPTVLQNSIS